MTFPCRFLFFVLSDSGLADVLMAGEGLSISVTLLATSGRTDSVFEVKKVLAHVGTLKIAIHGTNKDWLYKVGPSLPTSPFFLCLEPR